MKKFLFASVSVLTIALVLSCNRENAPETPAPEVQDGFHAVARMSVPCGTREVMVETYSLDTKGHKTGLSCQKVAVTPTVAAPRDGKDVEPFGQVSLLLQAPRETLASVYYTVSGTVSDVKAEAGDRTREACYVVVDLPVNCAGSGAAVKADGDPVPVYLPDPAPYLTQDGCQTLYQSSGVVMFEDCWPKLPPKNDNDYNDMVVDYDITALTVPDDQLEAEGWREQLKVVLHVRAISGDPERVGLILEGFDIQNVESISEYKTLDSYNSGHGQLPLWLQNRVLENAIHYDPLSSEYPTSVWDRPAVEMGRLSLFNNSSSNAGSETYTYINNGKETLHVMNPALKQYSQWGGAHTEQYSPDLDPSLVTAAQKTVYYNVVPGYVNVSGGLYTYTVVYHMKPRANMTPAQSEAALQNMIDAVVNTTSQNFYIVNKNYTPVGLKGYAPYNLSVKNYSDYSAKYASEYQSHKEDLSPDTYYKGINGEVWGFKCPTLTRHVWNRMSFDKAYPHYQEWVSSNGEQYPDWYVNGVDNIYLCCWW